MRILTLSGSADLSGGVFRLAKTKTKGFRGSVLSLVTEIAVKYNGSLSRSVASVLGSSNVDELMGAPI